MQAKLGLPLATLLTATLPILLFGYTAELLSQPTTSAATDHQNASADKYRKGATLRNKHWRNLFYGYDTLNYRLIAEQGQYRLAVSADYGDRDRRYFSARSIDDSDRELIDYHHQKQRCQFFNNMVYACLIRDQFTIPISETELLAAKQTGLRFTLRSKAVSYETLVVPPDYIHRFLEPSPSKAVRPEAR